MNAVARCPSCGSDLADSVNFCPVCGARVAAPAAETRRQVTVLFCDLVASTTMGGSLDSEVLRVLMTRFFAAVKEAIERHGGTVEKFIGDAVMAVFGLPDLHEDDALRAVRASVDVRAAVLTLSQSIEAQFGRSLQVRMGLNTGEVVAADDSSGQRLVTGDAVNLAARLEQAAEPGEILIGPLTHQLVRHAVSVDSLPPLNVKGAADPVNAFRLIGLAEDGAESQGAMVTTFVGRARELGLLRDRFAATLQERSCEIVTVVGSAGIGKSRLVHEFLAEVADRATILRGRCLPYGEGITYWPIALVVKAAAGIEDTDDAHTARSRLDTAAAPMPDGGSIAAALAAAIGLESATSASREQIGWAFRRFLEGLAHDHPLIAVIDDIQWGDPTLLDLLESAAALSSDASILLLCLARPEIAEHRPGWSAGLPGALTIELAPLSDEASESLIESLADNLPLPAPTIRRLRDAAEGNPLFLEELVAMFVDEGLLRRVNGRWEAVDDPRQARVPPTVQAVLAARLDRLPAGDRSVAQRAAVVGRIFERGAVIELSPEAERPQVERNLVNLVRGEVIRPDARGIGGDDTFRFRHLLVRDAAYERLSKQERSQLHHRFADWLERTVGERLAEFEEIVGYHLEQAYQYRSELGEFDGTTEALQRRAADHLGRAARRAWDRSDLAAAASLLRRALAAVGTEDPRWPEWAADRIAALGEAGNEIEARELLSELDQLAATSADAGSRAWAIVARAGFQNLFGDFDPNRDRDLLQNATDWFAAAQDERGLSRAWLSRAWIPWLALRGGEANDAVMAALGHARRSACRGDEMAALAFLTNVLMWGPTPVSDALTAYDQITREAGDDLRVQASVARGRAVLLAMQGDFDAARAEQDRCVELFRDLGLPIEAAEAAQSGSEILAWAGDITAAAALLATASDELESLKELGLRSTHRGMLARFLVEMGRLDDAESEAIASRNLTQPDDRITEILWRSALALIHSQRGDPKEADQLSLEAVRLVGDSDFWHTASAFIARAEVLSSAGRHLEADEAMAHAIEIYRAKGATAVVERLEAVRPA